MAERYLLVMGMHAVEAALEQGSAVLEVLIDPRRHDARMQQIISAAERAGIKIRRLSGAELDQLTGNGRHQGVAAQVKHPESYDEPYLKSLLKRLSMPPFLLVLDGVQDPHNLGACLRTADAAGVHAVIAPRDRAVGLTPTVCKVASGAAETVPYVQVTNLARTLQWMKAEGVWLVGTAGDAQASLYDADLRGPIALVMGSEGKGLRRLTKEQCDILINIPMCGSVQSLNVSVATGVALYEVLRTRTKQVSGLKAEKF